MNKKLVLILTLLSLTTIIKACDDDKACETTSTSSTKSTDQYLFDEAKEKINTDYPNGVDVITTLNHKGFAPAQKLYSQIRLFEEIKENYNQFFSESRIHPIITKLCQDGFIPAQLLLEKIERYEDSRSGRHSISKQVQILQSLSKEGFARAQTKLAISLMGLAQDKEQGLELLQEAALQQDSVACYHVGTRYWDGSDKMPKDKKEALKYIRMARIFGNHFFKTHHMDCRNQF